MAPRDNLHRKLAILREEARNPDYTPAERSAARAEATELERKLRDLEPPMRVVLQGRIGGFQD
jgi:hypothetical protein